MPHSLIDHFRAMARNNAWSNSRLLEACGHLTPDEFAARRVSFFPSLVETLNHILVVDRYYLADLTGTGRVILADEVPYPSVADLAQAQAETDRELIAFCNVLDDADLERVVTIDRKDGVENHETVAAILAHVFVHQIHHRGQAHAMLAGTPVAPPQLDEFFLASDAPRRDAELQRLGIAEPAQHERRPEQR
ncbi:DinB family protein [Limobrevibacterium gyesilva]|uniref:DinB family protein n=1 Tax=Limobrevibacterium gyesilva TaxID=2991712 RepID=A0AA41YNF5_9PROT|nr:DinB family protein [Limobrevibacterium gyesilva]MCW3476739.1 DinB family protein [Limobrevibacterium gyesilva]